MVFSKEIKIKTTTQFEMIDITGQVEQAVSKSMVKNGLVVVFAPHTTSAIRVNHSEPLLKQDIMKMLYRLVPVDMNYAHDFFEIRDKVDPHERSNGHAHLKAFLLGDSEAVPVIKGRMALGDKQSIFFVELDGGRKERKVIIQIVGD